MENLSYLDYPQKSLLPERCNLGIIASIHAFIFKMKMKHRFIPFKLLDVVVVLLRLVIWCPADGAQEGQDLMR
jgi:hypothetical protein